MKRFQTLVEKKKVNKINVGREREQGGSKIKTSLKVLSNYRSDQTER